MIAIRSDPCQFGSKSGRVRPGQAYVGSSGLVHVDFVGWDFCVRSKSFRTPAFTPTYRAQIQLIELIVSQVLFVGEKQKI